MYMPQIAAYGAHGCLLAVSMSSGPCDRAVQVSSNNFDKTQKKREKSKQALTKKVDSNQSNKQITELNIHPLSPSPPHTHTHPSTTANSGNSMRTPGRLIQHKIYLAFIIKFPKVTQHEYLTKMANEERRVAMEYIQTGLDKIICQYG